MLLQARWEEQAGTVDAKQLQTKYRDVVELCSQWEKGHFYLGKYYNQQVDEAAARYQRLCEKYNAMKSEKGEAAKEDRKLIIRERNDTYV